MNLNKKITIISLIIFLLLSCEDEKNIINCTSFKDVDKIESSTIQKVAGTSIDYSTSEIHYKVIDIIASILSIDYSLIKLESNLVKDLGFDELELKALKTNINNEFNCKISDEEYNNNQTVSDIIEVISDEIVMTYYYKEQPVSTPMSVHFNGTEIDEFINIRLQYKEGHNKNRTRIVVEELTSSLSSPSSYITDDNRVFEMTYTSNKDDSNWSEFSQRATWKGSLVVKMKFRDYTTTGKCDLVFKAIINEYFNFFETGSYIENTSIKTEYTPDYVEPKNPPVEPKNPIDTVFVFSKLQLVIADKLGISTDSITKEMSFTRDSDSDILDIWEIVFEVEREFSIQITDSEFENLQTVGDLYNYIIMKLQAK